jgi:protein-tyrosine-phosphatase
MVRTIHGMREPLTGWNSVKFSVYERLERAALRRRADVLIAVSGHIADVLHQSGYAPEQVAQIHNGIDVRTVLASRPIDQVRRELGIGMERLVIGTVGRLMRVKGHAALIHAARSSLDERPGAVFLFVGDGPLRQELSTLAAQLGIEHACVFAGARTDVYDLIAAMDVFVLPSLSEGTPIALLEAMALRVPVVATAVGGVPEVVTHGVNGLLVEAGDAEGLSRACLQLATDRVKAHRLAVRARQDVESTFSAARSGDALVEAYKRIGGAPRSTRAWQLSGLWFGSLIALFDRAALKLRHAFERYRRRKAHRQESARLTNMLCWANTVLVVCHGNIIRSAFASRLLARQVNGDGMSVASAGLAATPGRQAHPNALAAAAAHRIDLSGHTASALDARRVRAADVIFVMDIPQLVALRARFPEARGRTFLLTSLADDVPPEVADPLLGDEAAFRRCFEHIARAVAPIAHTLAPSESQP